MRHILPSLVCAAVPYFSTLYYKRHDFRGKNIIEHKNVCFDFHYNICLKHIYAVQQDTQCGLMSKFIQQLY